jgi:cobalt/nickel transport system permease protein
VAAVFLQTLPAAAVALVGTLVLACCGRLPAAWCLARLRTAALVIAPFLILLPFLHGGEGPVWHVGRVHVSIEGLRLALLLATKALTLVLLVLVLLATAPLPDTLKAAQALYIPGPLVQVAALTYRYVFVFSAELNRLRVALRARGYRNRMTVHCYRTAGHVAGTLLVRGYEQGERVGQAMRCRGFDGCFRTLNDCQTRTADVVCFVLIAGSGVALVAWDLLGR